MLLHLRRCSHRPSAPAHPPRVSAAVGVRLSAAAGSIEVRLLESLPLLAVGTCCSLPSAVRSASVRPLQVAAAVRRSIRTALVPSASSLSAPGSIVTDSSNTTFCVYDSDIATGYGVGAFLFLLSGHSLLMGVTRCMCFGAPLAPGGSRAWSIMYFASSWITFAIAEACLIAGATKNAYHTKYRDMVYAGNWTCQSLRKGVFIAGAVFVVFTMILNVYFYMYYSKATSQAAKRISETTPSVGMTGYA